MYYHNANRNITFTLKDCKVRLTSIVHVYIHGQQLCLNSLHLRFLLSLFLIRHNCFVTWLTTSCMPIKMNCNCCKRICMLLLYYMLSNISYYLHLYNYYDTVIATSLFINKRYYFIVLDIYVCTNVLQMGIFDPCSVDNAQLVNIVHIHVYVCVECNYVSLSLSFSLDNVIYSKSQSSFIYGMVRRLERMGQNKKKRTYGTVYYWKTGRRGKLSNAMLLL